MVVSQFEIPSSSIKENINVSPIEGDNDQKGEIQHVPRWELFHKKLAPIKEAISELCKEFNVEEGISIHLDKKRGVHAVIDVEQFR